MDGGRWVVNGGRWTVDGGRWTVLCWTERGLLVPDVNPAASISRWLAPGAAPSSVRTSPIDRRHGAASAVSGGSGGRAVSERTAGAARTQLGNLTAHQMVPEQLGPEVLPKRPHCRPRGLRSGGPSSIGTREPVLSASPQQKQPPVPSRSEPVRPTSGLAPPGGSSVEKPSQATRRPTTSYPRQAY